jgi:uncharacterized protein YdhG (YjbR/CyaY superfamily)
MARKSVKTKCKTIDEYLARVRDDEKRDALQNLRKTIRAAAPNASECISYGVPAFRVNGTLVAGFAAASGHCAYFPMSGSLVAAHAEDLKDYETSKGTIRFHPGHPLPARLVRTLVKARIAEDG